MKCQENIRIFKVVFLYSLFLLLPGALQAQSKFKIDKHQYQAEIRKVINEWGTEDDIRDVYLKHKSKKEKVLSYYAFKDEGGDCNSLFWNKASIKVKRDKLIVIVHHFQKTGIDPITEWEQITYRVNDYGKLSLTEHLYKKFGSDEWKLEEEWYR